MSQEPHYANKIMKGKKKHYSFVAANPEDTEMEIFFFSPKKRKKKIHS